MGAAVTDHPTAGAAAPPPLHSASGKGAVVTDHPAAGAAAPLPQHPAFILDPARGYFSLCDVQRLAAAPVPGPGGGTPYLWLAAKGSVFKVPREWAERVHPGGSFSILSHAGTDSSVDFDFHSAHAQGVWHKFREGRLLPCTGVTCSIV